MIKARLLLPLLAIAALGGVYRVWRFGEERSAQRFLESAEKRLDQVEPDYRTALRELDRGLDLARRDDDQEIIEQLLLVRANVYSRNRAPINALEDYRVLLDEYLPEDITLLKSAAKTALTADRLDDARGFVERWIELTPRQGAAWLERGKIELRRAERSVEEFTSRLSKSLPEDLAIEARQAATQVAYLPPGSDLRAAPFGKLVSMRDPSDIGADLSELGRISDMVATARESFEQSLRFGLNSRAIAYIQGLLRRAGRSEESALLGSYALGVPNFNVRQVLAAESTLALLEAKRPGSARDVWKYTREDLGLEPAFGSMPVDLAFPLACGLGRLGRWEDLDSAFDSLEWLNRSREDPLDLTFLNGALSVGLGSTQEGIAILSRIGVESHQLYPGANLDAVLLLDDTLRGTPSTRWNTSSLITRLAGDPDPGTPLARRLAEAHEVLARTSHEDEDDLGAERSLGRALSLVGEEPELISLWEEWGADRLRKNGRTADAIADNIVADQQSLDSGTYSYYEILVAAKSLYRRGSIAYARNTLSQLRKTLPDLPQALHLDGQVHLALDEIDRASLRWAQRLAIGGPGREKTIDALLTLPWDSIPSPTRLRILRAAPDDFGPFVRLRNLAESGRQAEAVAWLERRDLPSMGAGLRAEAARLYAALGRWDKVREVLLLLPSDTPAAGKTSGLLLRALIRTPEGLDDEVLDRVAMAEADDEHLILAVDKLFADGRTTEAKDVLERLLQERELRQPAIAERYLTATLAEVGKLANKLGEYRAAVDDEAAALLRLASATDALELEVIESEAGELAFLPFARTPYRSALCRILTGAPEEALLTLDSLDGTTFALNEAKRFMALGLARSLATPPSDDDSPESETFVRFLTCTLLALERPSITPWALTRLRSLPPRLGEDSRVRMLEAMALMALGADDRAEALSVRLCESGEVEAWLVREELARERLGPTSNAFLRLRTKRVEALGARGLSIDELGLHQSRATEAAGDPKQALAILDRSLREHPGAPSLLAERARLRAELNGPIDALEDYHGLFDVLPPELAGRHVPKYLELVHAANAEGQLSDRALMAYVEALSIALPTEPAAVGELARMVTAEGGQAGLARAWELLENFLYITEDSVEGLQPGEAERWMRLFLRYDPERATDFAERELEVRPESPAVWSNWVDALHASQRFDEAFEELSLFVRFHPEPEVLRRVPLFAADQGATPEEVDDHMARTVTAIHISGGDSKGLQVFDYSHDLAAFERARPLGPEALARLEGAWHALAEISSPRDRQRLTAAYASALLQTGEAGVQGTARAAIETMRSAPEDALGAHVSEVLYQLTRSLKPR